MKIKLALAQIKPTLGNLKKNFEIHLKAIARAKKEKCDLVVFPELSMTGYFLRDLVSEVAMPIEHPFIERFARESKKISIVLGFVEHSPDVQLFNTAAYFEGGKIRHLHRKVYLPTYGMFDEQRYLAHGDRIRAFDTDFTRSALLICEDLWHPIAPYLAAMDKAQVLYALSSSPGRGVDRDKRLLSSRLWEQLNRLYAQFYTSYVVFSNRVGFEDGVQFWGGSEVISPDGKCLAKAAYHREDFVTATLDSRSLERERILTPLLRDEKMELVMRELNRLYEEDSRKPF